MNIIKNIFKTSKNLVTSAVQKKLTVLNSEETLDYILKNNVSIGRYGDGELEIMLGNGICFQDYNEKLSQKLKEIKTDDKFLTCIPNIFNKKTFNNKVLNQDEFNFWKKHKLLYSSTWKKYFNNQMCGDAELSRFYIRYVDKSKVGDYISKFKQLWDNRNIIIVEGETSKVGCENDLLSNTLSIRRIIGPSRNAFDYYDELLKAVKSNYNEGDLVLLALGPTATALAYDLSRFNIQALDLGHFDIEYEWFLAKADKKIPVKNKHVNECQTSGTSETSDNTYKNQITYKINQNDKNK